MTWSFYLKKSKLICVKVPMHTRKFKRICAKWVCLWGLGLGVIFFFFFYLICVSWSFYNKYIVLVSKKLCGFCLFLLLKVNPPSPNTHTHTHSSLEDFKFLPLGGRRLSLDSRRSSCLIQVIAASVGFGIVPASFCLTSKNRVSYFFPSLASLPIYLIPVPA